MPLATTADQGSLLWGSFLLGISFLGIIIAHVRDVVIFIIVFLRPDLDVDHSAAMSSSDPLNLSVTRIVWKQKPRKPPDKSNNIGLEIHPI